jgi:hypothetical protein
MRKINSPQQLQLAINEILDYIQKYPAGASWDFRGNRITNAGNSVGQQDYITRAELPGLVAPLLSSKNNPSTLVSYTILFTPPDGAADGSTSPAYVVGINRSGKPNQAWLTCNGAPISNPLACNILYQGNPILESNLIIPIGSTTAVTTSTFVTPTPTLAQLSQIQMSIVTDGQATGVSMGLVVQVIS